MNPNPQIQYLLDKNQLRYDGKNQDVIRVEKKFIWLKLRFEPEYWIVRTLLVYSDPKDRFPVFDWRERKFKTELEMHQTLLLEQFEEATNP